MPARAFHAALSEGNASPLTKEDADNILVFLLRMQQGTSDPWLIWDYIDRNNLLDLLKQGEDISSERAEMTRMSNEMVEEDEPL